MDIQLRQEQPGDFQRVSEIIEAAFKNEPHSDHSEHVLVERLRISDAFIPELSIVAETLNQVVGHILVTRININNQDVSFESLALAPVSVDPEMQGRGIGGLLIKEVHSIAKSLGYGSIVLLGHTDYYPRFGYKRASKFGITLPFDVPDENVMVVELRDGALNGVSGIVEYAKEFFE